MKKYSITLLLLAGFIYVKSQQLPLYSQYMLNDYLVNPAVAGKKPFIEGSTNIRYQWQGIVDAPRTYILSANGPWKDKNIGVGGYIFNDVTGPTRRAGFQATYAYHLKLSETMKLGMGLSGGLLQYAVDGAKIVVETSGDPALSAGVQSVLVPDFGFGAQLYTDNYFVGISAPQVLNNNLKFFDNYTSLSKLTTHFYLTGGYRYAINDDYTVEPSVAVRFSYPAPIQFDLGARAVYKKLLWLGAMYRTQDALSFMIGYTFQENITFSYAYDFPISNIRKYTSGSHEVMIGFRFK